MRNERIRPSHLPLAGALPKGKARLRVPHTCPQEMIFDLLVGVAENVDPDRFGGKSSPHGYHIKAFPQGVGGICDAFSGANDG